MSSAAPPRTNGTLTAEQMQVLQLRNNPHLMMQQQQHGMQFQQALSTDGRMSLQQPQAPPPDGLMANRVALSLNQQQQIALFLQQKQQRGQQHLPTNLSGVVMTSGAAKPAINNNNDNSGVDAISRLFGQSTDTMPPPLPMNSSRVMTVDEIEQQPVN
jgi:hypothetical protein